MKLLIISDIHSNYEALLTVAHAEEADEVWCLGDLVDFGAQPAEAVQWVRHHTRASRCVQGNHDHALAFSVDCHSGPAFHELAVRTREMNRALLSPEQLDYLSKLPTRVDATLEGSRFHLAHAGPGGDLYRFDITPKITPKISDAVLARALEGIEADFVFCGHTHLPMIRKVGHKTFANPGSVGLPLDGDPRASYAVWYDGKVQLCRAKYAVEKAVQKVIESAVPAAVAEQIAKILRTGARQAAGTE